jgi:hypothetical protein
MQARLDAQRGVSFPFPSSTESSGVQLEDKGSPQLHRAPLLEY